MTETNDCEQYIESFAKENFYPSLHLAGSCRMGSSTDPKAIVDGKLKVRDTENLRVIDA